MLHIAHIIFEIVALPQPYKFSLKKGFFIIQGASNPLPLSIISSGLPRAPDGHCESDTDSLQDWGRPIPVYLHASTLTRCRGTETEGSLRNYNFQFY